MSGLVVDASAALKLVRAERGRERVRELLGERIRAGQPVLVPALFWLEVVNVMTTRYRYPPETVVEAVFELEQTGITTAEVGRPGILAMIDAIGRTGLSAYDAAYLVLAESEDADLVTADARLASAAGDRGILVGEPGAISEARAPHVPAATWARWKGAAAYLGELRAAI